MFLPREVYLQKSSIYAESELAGLANLVISQDSRFDVTQDAHVNSPSKATVLLDGVTILNGGMFYQRTAEPAKLTVNLTGEMIINAGASMDVSQVHLQAHNIFIDIGGVFTARGRGFASMKGTEPGEKSAIASGAGHGGAGGRSSSQPLVGKAYDSFDMPLHFGSGGGQGYQDLVRPKVASLLFLEQAKTVTALYEHSCLFFVPNYLFCRKRIS